MREGRGVWGAGGDWLKGDRRGQQRTEAESLEDRGLPLSQQGSEWGLSSAKMIKLS